MANQLATIDNITREAQRFAHEKGTFIGTVQRQFDDEFGKAGRKIGSTLRIRKAEQFTVTEGSRAMDVQDSNEESDTLVLATQDHVDMEFNSSEMLLSLDDVSKRKIEPAMKTLISKVESKFIQGVTKEIYNLVGTKAVHVGASGNTLALGQARARLSKYLAPKDKMRSFQLDSDVMANITEGNKVLFTPDAEISKSFLEGFYGRNAGMNFFENERMYSHFNGDDVAGEVDFDGGATAIAEGGNSMNVDGLGTTVTEGSVFTVAGVYAVHPETKDSYTFLQQFVVVGTPTIGTNQGVITFSPAVYADGAKKNVTALPANGAAVTFFGDASNTTGYIQNLAYHKEAFAFVTGELPLMGDSLRCVRKTQDGVSLRVWQQSDIVNDRMLLRIDMLYGWKTLRPEWAVRVSSG